MKNVLLCDSNTNEIIIIQHVFVSFFLTGVRLKNERVNTIWNQKIGIYPKYNPHQQTKRDET